MAALSIIKPFRWPWLWVGLWSLAVLTIIGICLISLPTMPELPTGSDKIEHFLAYFILAAGVIQLYQGKSRRLSFGVFLILMGIGVELAQGGLTATRHADIHDAIANAVGVLAGLATAYTPWQDLLLQMETRATRLRQP